MNCYSVVDVCTSPCVSVGCGRLTWLHLCGYVMSSVVLLYCQKVVGSITDGVFCEVSLTSFVIPISFCIGNMFIHRF